MSLFYQPLKQAVFIPDTFTSGLVELDLQFTFPSG